MKDKLTGRKRRAFCRAYLACMDAQRAAEQCGLADGYELLELPTVRTELENIRAEANDICRADAVRRLCAVAFGRPNDAIRLALGDGLTGGEIDALDLSAVAEFKRSSTGGVEMKFFDRAKALELLCGILGGAEDNGAAEEFFRAVGAETEDETWADE